MERKIRVRGVFKEEFDVGLYVLALIELARQLQEQEERAVRESETEVTTSATGTEEVADD
jgi:hypothetical protein